MSCADLRAIIEGARGRRLGVDEFSQFCGRVRAQVIGCEFCDGIECQDGKTKRMLAEFDGEARPLEIAALHLPEITELQWHGGSNLGYDGVFTLTEGSQISVECTWAKDGWNNKLADEHAKKYGSAPIQTKIDIVGSGRKREVKKTPLSDGLHWSYEAKQALDAIFNKSDTKYRGYWLLVRLEDSFLFGHESERQEFCDFIESRISDHQIFSRIVLLGHDSGIVFDQAY